MKELKMAFYKHFNQKGFQNDEIPFLISDLKRYFIKRNNYSLQVLNREMETLGWGIQIVDQALYEDLLYYYENKR